MFDAGWNSTRITVWGVMYEFTSDFLPGECATEGLDRATQYIESDLYWSILLGKIAEMVYILCYDEINIHLWFVVGHVCISYMVGE